MIRAVWAVLAGAFLAAALLTPPVYALLASFLDEVPWPFTRVFNRMLLLAALALLFAFRRRLELDRVRAALAGGARGERVRAFAAGLGWSLGLSLAALGLALRGGDLALGDGSAGDLALRWLRNLPGAVIVSLLEEILFRLLLFRGLQRFAPWPIAAAISSAVYSVLHLLSPPHGYDPGPIDAGAGFRYLARLFSDVLDPAYLPALFALGLIGFVLCASLQRSSSPWRCIGLHAGWFLAAKLAVYATVPPTDATSQLPVRFLALSLPWTLAAVAAVGWLEVRRTPRAQPAVTS